MTSRFTIDRVARHVRRPDTPSWLPRTPQVALHQGVLDAVDPGRGVANLAMNDPSGLIIPGIRYLQAYTALTPPEAGDVVWAQQHGTDLVILGRHVVPDSFITL